MIPLLPALILLLLHGPAGLEGVNADLRLPDAIRALQGHKRAGAPAEAKLKNLESDLVLASLIAAGGDDELGKVVQELLKLIAGPADQAETDVSPGSETPRIQIAIQERLPRWPDLSIGRTRDGPAVS